MFCSCVFMLKFFHMILPLPWSTLFPYTTLFRSIPYSVTTSEYNEVGEGRGKETAKRAGIGAGIGAAIGAIAGGGKGAAIGAGVGGAGGTAIQVLTKGEKLNIPSETKLEFTLRSPLV